MSDIDYFHDSLDEEIIEIKKPTPMMKVWMRDAEDFGIPFEVQKGLIFLIAFGLRSTFQPKSIEDWISHTKKLSSKIRLKSPHIPEGQGGNFYDKDFSPLLTELAERFMGDGFTPRQIPSNSPHKTYTVWDREGRGNMLPECLHEKMWRMAHWDEVMTSLYGQIGKGIRMNLEGAYLAGFLYFESQLYFDKAATYQIATLVSGMLPPKYMWFQSILNVDLETAKKVSPIQKVFDSFMDGIPQETPFLYSLVSHIFGLIHFKSRDVKRSDVWEYSVPQFAYFMVQHHDWFEYKEEPSAGEIKKLRAILLQEKGFEAPPCCKTPNEAMALVGHQIAERWGYSMYEEGENLPQCDQWTRRCCITYQCTVNSIIDPGWNKFE